MAGSKASLRIGLLHYSCPPVVGGVEQVIGQHSVVLQRLGQEIYVLAGMGKAFPRGEKVLVEPLIGSRNGRVREANRLSRKGDHKLTHRLVQQILCILQDWSRELDVILAHNVLHMPFNLPLALAVTELAGQKAAPPVVSWAHDSPYFSASAPDYLFKPPWNCLRLRQPHVHYVTISHSRKLLYEKHLGDFSWTVVHNGIDPEGFFYLDPETVRLATELRLFERDLVVVQPARITPRKNQELAIAIVHGIKRMGSNVMFILPGAYDPHEPKATAYYRKLNRLIEKLGMEDSIAILAEYTFADGARLVPDRIFIRDLYLIADLLMMTSIDEGFGLPLLEAGMAKLPIACTNLPIFKEICTDVCFIRAEDPPLYSAGRIMEHLARTGPHRMFRNVMRNYVWDAICQTELLPFLRKIAAPPKRLPRPAP